MAIAMPATIFVGWLAVASLGQLADVASERIGGWADKIWLAHALVLGVPQIWITREAFERAGFLPRLSFMGVAVLFFQNLLVSLLVLLGALLLIIPSFYVAARFYLAGAILVDRGKGPGEAMWRSWDLLARHWPTALLIGLMFMLLWGMRYLVIYLSPVVMPHEVFLFNLGLNMLSAAGIVGGYIAAVALLIELDPPESIFGKIFG